MSTGFDGRRKVAYWSATTGRPRLVDPDTGMIFLQ
jgi:hypothetical protein